MTMIIQRCRLEGVPLQPGFWRRAESPLGPMPQLGCPVCTTPIRLAIRHTSIDETGFVEQKIHCPALLCTFSAHITLDSFSPPKGIAA